METGTFLQELFAYNRYRNAELTDYLMQQENVPEKALTLLGHMLNAHEIWNSRIRGVQPKYGVWEERELAGLQSSDRENFETSLTILGDTDLSATISYRTSKGEPFSSSVRDILFHVINHSTYHRGQIMSALKAAGIAPLITDYIFHRRATLSL